MAGRWHRHLCGGMRENWTKDQQQNTSTYFPQNHVSGGETPNAQVHSNVKGSFSGRHGFENAKQGYSNNGSVSSADHQNNTYHQIYQQGPHPERHEASEKVTEKRTSSSRMVQEPVEITNKDDSQDMNNNTVMSGIDRQHCCVPEQSARADHMDLAMHSARVYLGTLNDGQKVAVKIPMRATETDKNDFKTELRVQSRIKHKNVVKLLGYCLEGGAPKLVYEFAANGNLYDKLHGNCRAPMLLDVRLRILLECAEALAYIHSSTDMYPSWRC
uniref:Protein kinase domain-containing protein n=1 Tax=Leersia perrieri TaxID=77586 RepID=A0A0D9XHK7_9ORYZ